MGQSAANIEWVAVRVGGMTVNPRLEGAREFWIRVMGMLDPAPGVIGADGQLIERDWAISSGEVCRLFTTRLEGDMERLRAAMRTLEVELQYVSHWGQRYTTRYDPN